MKDKIVKLLLYVSLTISVFIFSTFSVNAAENDVDTATEGDATVIEYKNSIENNPDTTDLPGGNDDGLTAGNNDDLPGGNNDDVPEDDTDKAVYATVFDGVDYSPVYDYEYYINRYHDLKAAYGNNDVAALRHFVIFGMKEGRTGNESFDVYSYFPAAREFGGFPSFGYKEPVLISHNGVNIKEFPICTTKLMGKELAYSGGGYFRFFPLWFIEKEIKKSTYSMCYFHIGDLISETRSLMTKEEYELKFKEKGTLINRLKRHVKINFGNKKSFSKLTKLIKNHQFVCLDEVDKQIDWTSCKQITI